MNEVIISVEVNSFWMKEQEGKGEKPFAKVESRVLEICPEAKIIINDNKLQIKRIRTEQNSEVRKAIKELFSNLYQMSIADGDYNMTAKISPMEETRRPEAAEEKKEEPEEAESEGNKSEEEKREEQPADPPDIPEEPVKEPEKTTQNILISPELDLFLKEYDIILKNAKRFKMDNMAWEANVLLSMDSGYGVSHTCKMIAAVLEKNGYVFNSKTKEIVVEYTIATQGTENPVGKPWKQVLSEIEHYSMEESKSGRRSSTMPFIFSIDVSECLGKNNEKMLYENLQQLQKIKGSFLYVFRIPYLEEVAFNSVRELLSDIFLIRPLSIAPYSNEKLAACLKEKLVANGIILEDGLDELLERLISLEKQDGRFEGLKTIERLATDIIYHRLSKITKEENIVISKDNLIDTYAAIKENDICPEILLEQLCGMENVKQTIDEIVAQIKLYKDLKDSGKKLSAPTMHMRFVGNPGTGKTTVARLVAQIFKQEGILNKGYFYEVKARDLCGRYVGETAPKTSRYCRDALGSVLFIDEAYTLYHGEHSADYGQEAIETLITEMENNRDNLVVIMAGYKKEMDELMKSNAGLQSRMPYEITFRNYTKDELIEIFFIMLGDSFAYTDGFDDAVKEFFYSIPDSVLEEEEFSNARLVRNLYERIWSKAAYRKKTSNLPEIVLQEDDVQRAISDEEFHRLLNGITKKIGF